MTNNFTVSTEEIRAQLQINIYREEVEVMRRRMESVARMLAAAADEIGKAAKTKFDSWFVCVKKTEKGYAFCGFFNINAGMDDNESQLPECDLVIPIPLINEATKEFNP